MLIFFNNCLCLSRMPQKHWNYFLYICPLSCRGQRGFQSVSERELIGKDRRLHRAKSPWLQVTTPKLDCGELRWVLGSPLDNQRLQGPVFFISPANKHLAKQFLIANPLTGLLVRIFCEKIPSGVFLDPRCWCLCAVCGL